MQLSHEPSIVPNWDYSYRCHEHSQKRIAQRYTGLVAWWTSLAARSPERMAPSM